MKKLHAWLSEGGQPELLKENPHSPFPTGLDFPAASARFGFLAIDLPRLMEMTYPEREMRERFPELGDEEAGQLAGELRSDLSLLTPEKRRREAKRLIEELENLSHR